VWLGRTAVEERAYQASNAHNLTHLVKGYDWRSLEKGLLVDVRDLMPSIFFTKLLTS
jgi:hypothetical protein